MNYLKALINVDLVEALRSIVKLKVDNYQSDIVYDILDLVNSKVNDYFCDLLTKLIIINLKKVNDNATFERNN